MSRRPKPAVPEPAKCRLYLLTPAPLDVEAFAPLLEQALDAGDVACLQLRREGLDDDALRAAALRLMPMAQSRGVAFLVEGHAALAAELGCDGVHIGPDDMPYEEARRLVGPNRIVGVACRDSRHAALEAAEAGADYVSFGAFFPSMTVASDSRPPVDLLEWWSDVMTVPVVAIGGISPANCGDLVAAGADFIAAVAAIWGDPRGPGAAVVDFERAIGTVVA